MPNQLRHPDLSPTMHLIAKKIFYKQHLTADFIRSVLNIPVVSVEILDGTQIQLAEYDHPNFYTAVDVCAKLEDGTQVIIEVQVTKQRSFFNRMLAYLANQITDNLKRLKTDQNKTHTLYSRMDPVYCIAILENEHFDGLNNLFIQAENLLSGTDSFAEINRINFYKGIYLLIQGNYDKGLSISQQAISILNQMRRPNLAREYKDFLGQYIER